MTREERLQLREQRKLVQNLNISRDSRPSDSSATSFSSNSVFPPKNVIQNRQIEASNASSSSSSSPPIHGLDLPQRAQPYKTNDSSQNSRESMYPASRFSEADKSKIRSALGIQKTAQMSPVAKPSSSTQLNGFELANVKKYMKRPGEVPQQQAFQRFVSPPNNSGYVWAPVRNSPNRYAIGRPINNLPNGQSQFISTANYQVLDSSHSVNFPDARPIKYIVPVKQYVAMEHDYSRHSFLQYSGEEQEEREYQWFISFDWASLDLFSNYQNQRSSQEQELWLLHRAVDRVLVEPFNRNPTSGKQGAYLRLKCKNFMVCCIEINDLEDCQAVARSIEKLSNLSGIEHDYPITIEVHLPC
uniref:MTMR6-9 GRAM domain-containing protein n=1 Tax=Ditylenchus dipsaci TaxID=166011 RepID=A0A915D8I3_9BILA